MIFFLLEIIVYHEGCLWMIVVTILGLWSCVENKVAGWVIVVFGVDVMLGRDVFYRAKRLKTKLFCHAQPGLPWTFSPDIDLEVETWWWEVGRPMFSIWKSGSRSAEHKLASFGRFCPKTTPKNGDVGSPHQKINVRPLPGPFTIQFFYPRIHTLMKTSHIALVLPSRL